MKTASAKAKGRRLQQVVVQAILEAFPTLEPDDVVSRSMGASGEDVMLSPAARKKFPYSVECKSLAKVAVYALYDQAVSNAGKYEPLLVVKANGRKPLVVIDLAYFMKLAKKSV